MRADDYDFMVTFLKERSGLVLTKDKTYLLENRLMPVARRRTLNSLDELFQLLRGGDDELAREVTEAMTTNESFFFRDLKPFEQFENLVLPRFIESRAAVKRLRIWCAAASTGQEPYSLAIILNENQAKLSDWHIEIVGTDISTEALQRAKAGRYTQFEVQRGLPIRYLVKYFKQVDSYWQISSNIRSMVKFRSFNLLDDVAAIGPVDIIFCRNVLIYFDQETKSRILDGMSALLPGDGVLFLGGAETVLGVSDKFKPNREIHGSYRLAGPADGSEFKAPRAPAAELVKQVAAQ